MKYYIIWKNGYDIEEIVQDICNDRESAVLQTKLYNGQGESKEEDYEWTFNIDHGFELSSSSNDYHFTELELNEKSLFILLFHESGGGGSYHDVTYLYFCSNLSTAIEDANNYMESEHNIDNDCEACRNDACYDKLVKELSQDLCSTIETSLYEPVTFHILERSLVRQ